MDTILLTMHWTDEEWKKYNCATAIVPLALLDSLLDAAKLAARGARVDKRSEREAWEIRVHETESIVSDMIAKISEANS